MKENDICLAIYINKKNIHVAIHNENEALKIIDLSYGYGKAYASSAVVFNEGEFLFLNDVVDADIYEDTLYFDSILELLENNVVIDGIESKDVLKLLIENILKYVYEINEDFNITNVVVSYENIEAYSDRFIEAFEKLNIIDVRFIEPNEALIYDVINASNSADILFLEFEKTYRINIVEKEQNRFIINEKLEKSFFVKHFIDYLYDKCVVFYKNSKEIDIVEFEDEYMIKQLVFDNIDSIINKYMEKTESKIVFNFCFPTLVLEISTFDLDEYFESTIKKIEGNKELFIYCEDIDDRFLFSLLGSEKTVNIFNGMFESLHKNISFVKADEVISEYGFFVRGKSEEKFVSIIKDKNSIEEKNFLFDRKTEQSIKLYKKIEDRIEFVLDLDLNDLEIDTDFAKLVVKGNYRESKINIEITNKGFLNKCNNNKIYFEIEV